MIKHEVLGNSQFARSRQLKLLIDTGEIACAGNAKLKIYGTLSCKSGKRMKTANRVFFHSEAAALRLGYRPCGHCLPVAYRIWKLAVK